jgi:uncharacterized damage-inducible protein DinB
VNRKQYFMRMFAYDHWANRECVIAMSSANSASSSTMGRIAHILSAQKLWLERLRQEPQTLPVWPGSTLPECAKLADEMAVLWRNYLAQLSPSGYDDKIEYRNSKGEAWSSRIEDVLTHVLLHSAYHRGQVALEMRGAGLEPAYTDFIHAVRQGFVK